MASRRKKNPSLNDVLRAIEAAGWRTRRGSKHLLIYPPDGSRPLTIGGSPQDHRTWKNTVAQLRRLGLDI